MISLLVMASLATPGVTAQMCTEVTEQFEMAYDEGMLTRKQVERLIKNCNAAVERGIQPSK